MRMLFYLLLFLCTTAYAFEIRLKEKLGQAQPGSYMVIEQNKTFTFLHIHERTEEALVFEEVSIAAACFAKNPMNWKEWFEKGAPGHTSWIISQVNLNTGVFEETFSFTHRRWIDMSESNSFLTTLLNLHFHETPDAERRRIGLPPGYNKTDHRPIWNPRLIVDGHIMTDTPFSAYKARWPADGTELSRKIIEIYLPEQTKENSCYPLYFPYWLEVEGKIGSAKIRVIDSGTGAHSPKKNLPKRPPRLLGEAKLEENGLLFQLKSPSYYREFFILAEENGGFFGNLLPLPCQISSDMKETITLFVPANEIKKLTSGSLYRFMISPKENPQIVLETSARL